VRCLHVARVNSLQKFLVKKTELPLAELKSSTRQEIRRIAKDRKTSKSDSRNKSLSEYGGKLKCLADYWNDGLAPNGFQFDELKSLRPITVSLVKRGMWTDESFNRIALSSIDHRIKELSLLI
jgi:hypothetical protein